MERACLRMVLLAVAVLAFSSTAHSVSRYVPTDLGQSASWATAINNSGVVVAQILYGGGLTWQDGHSTYLSGWPEDVNDSGLAVGVYWEEDMAHAVYWIDAVATDIDRCGYESRAFGVNNSGVIVGVSRELRYDEVEGWWVIIRPVRWDNGVMSYLPVPEGSVNGYAYGINDRGDIVGECNYRPALWRDGTLRFVSQTGGAIWRINNRGQMAGWLSDYDPVNGWRVRACMWDGDEEIELGNLGREISRAFGINDAGQVVGYSETTEMWDEYSAVEHAFLWENGQLYDLNTLLDSAPDWVMYYAYDINNSGQIVGDAHYPGIWDNACILNPVNRPPDVSKAYASTATIWPPTATLIPVKVKGVTDADGDPVVIRITAITQDEPVLGGIYGNLAPDGKGVGTDTAYVRGERSDRANGRVYAISFVADDGKGGVSAGKVNVGVPVPDPRKPGMICTDNGQKYDSTKMR